MIDTASVKMRIIRMAISGELTKRPETDFNIEQCLATIHEEYLRLLKNGETKKKKEAPMIEEGLFEIPQSWAWVPLGKLCTFLSRGKSPKYSSEKLYPVFAQKCNQPNGLALEKAKFLDKNTLEKWAPYFLLHEQDVLINSTGTGTMGRVGFYLTESLDDQYPFMLPDSHVTVARFGTGVIPKYIFYVLRSVPIQAIMERQFRGTTNQKEFYIESVYSIPIPLPTTSEQIEIVSKLDEAIELLEHIDKTQNEYHSDFNVLKSKIIDAGIRGELTEQLAEDGTARELYQQIQIERTRKEQEKEIKEVELLPDIEEGEEPFAIPSSWMWTRFGNTSYIVRGGSPRPIKQFVTDDPTGINWIKIGDVEKGGKYIYETKERIIPEGEKKSRRVAPGDFLLTNSMSFGRPYISKIDGCIHDGWLLIRNLKGFDDNYLYYLLSSTYMYNEFCQRASGSTVDNLNIEKVSSAFVPLPPLAEQKRIAERIDELLLAISQ